MHLLDWGLGYGYTYSNNIKYVEHINSYILITFIINMLSNQLIINLL